MDEFVIGLSLFPIPKKVVLLEITYCPRHEASTKITYKIIYV